ncbi:MAG: aminotransferase class I/II-fold pyridoxal phosphate-dependent enzyme [Bacillota bacterium]
MLRLDLNESPLDVDLELKQSICRELETVAFNRYCTPEASGLVQALADYAGVDPAWVVPGNGADEMIAVTISALAGPGGRVVIPSPTFPMYSVSARWAGAQVVEVASPPPGFHLNGDGLETAVRQGPPRTAGRPGTVAIICRPNNPTGHSCPVDLVERLLGLPGDPVVVVDEAYFEFSRTTVAPLLGRYPGLVVLRTMSKAFCLAGIRVGYALARPDLARELNQARLPFNISAANQVIAKALLREAPRFVALGGRIQAWTQDLQRGLAGTPGVVRALPTETNFVLFEPRKPALRVREELLECGIAVRYYPRIPALERYIRVSTGTPEENLRFLTDLAKVLENP